MVEPVLAIGPETQAVLQLDEELISIIEECETAKREARQRHESPSGGTSSEIDGDGEGRPIENASLRALPQTLRCCLQGRG